MARIGNSADFMIETKRVIDMPKLEKMRALRDFEKPVFGQFTGKMYPFHQRKVLFVDARDAVYLLGEDLDIVQ